jgi:hypothetical protein
MDESDDGKGKEEKVEKKSGKVAAREQAQQKLHQQDSAAGWSTKTTQANMPKFTQKAAVNFDPEGQFSPSQLLFRIWTPAIQSAILTHTNENGKREYDKAFAVYRRKLRLWEKHSPLSPQRRRGRKTKQSDSVSDSGIGLGLDSSSSTESKSDSKRDSAIAATSVQSDSVSDSGIGLGLDSSSSAESKSDSKFGSAISATSAGGLYDLNFFGKALPTGRRKAKKRLSFGDAECQPDSADSKAEPASVGSGSAACTFVFCFLPMSSSQRSCYCHIYAAVTSSFAASVDSPADQETPLFKPTAPIKMPPITSKELHIWIGIRVFMGAHHVVDARRMWSNTASARPRTLLSALHWLVVTGRSCTCAAFQKLLSKCREIGSCTLSGSSTCWIPTLFQKPRKEIFSGEFAHWLMQSGITVASPSFVANFRFKVDLFCTFYLSCGSICSLAKLVLTVFCVACSVSTRAYVFSKAVLLASRYLDCDGSVSSVLLTLLLFACSISRRSPRSGGSRFGIAWITSLARLLISRFIFAADLFDFMSAVDPLDSNLDPQRACLCGFDCLAPVISGSETENRGEERRTGRRWRRRGAATN